MAKSFFSDTDKMKERCRRLTQGDEKVMDCKGSSLSVNTVQDVDSSTSKVVEYEGFSEKDVKCKDGSSTVKTLQLNCKYTSITEKKNPKRRNFTKPREIKSKAVNFRMKPSIYDCLQETAKANGLSLIDALEEAIVAYSEVTKNKV